MILLIGNHDVADPLEIPIAFLDAWRAYDQ
jgi:hypothetical protein